MLLFAEMTMLKFSSPRGGLKGRPLRKTKILLNFRGKKVPTAIKLEGGFIGTAIKKIYFFCRFLYLIVLHPPDPVLQLLCSLLPVLGVLPQPQLLQRLIPRIELTLTVQIVDG